MTSRPLTALVAAACALVAAVGAFAASPGPAEQVLLVPADVALAKKVALQKADLGPGWVRKASSASSGAPGTGCQVGVDLSQFTITGGADVDYDAKGAFVGSSVLVFPTAAQAAGDLAANMSPAARKCMAQLIATGFGDAARNAGSGVRFQLGATKVFPSVGFKALRAEHVYAYAISSRVSGPGGTVPLSMSILGVAKGRVVALLFATSVSRDAMPLAPLARKMLDRFPGAWVIAA